MLPTIIRTIEIGIETETGTDGPLLLATRSDTAAIGNEKMKKKNTLRFGYLKMTFHFLADVMDMVVLRTVQFQITTASGTTDLRLRMEANGATVTVLQPVPLITVTSSRPRLIFLHLAGYRVAMAALIGQCRAAAVAAATRIAVTITVVTAFPIGAHLYLLLPTGHEGQKVVPLQHPCTVSETDSCIILGPYLSHLSLSLSLSNCLVLR